MRYLTPSLIYSDTRLGASILSINASGEVTDIEAFERETANTSYIPYPVAIVDADTHEPVCRACGDRCMAKVMAPTPYLLP